MWALSPYVLISCDSGFLVHADTVRVTLEYTGVGKSCLSQTTCQTTQMLGTQVKELQQSSIKFSESGCCLWISVWEHKSLLSQGSDNSWTRRKHPLVYPCLPWLIIAISSAREKVMISPTETEGGPKKIVYEFSSDW